MPHVLREGLVRGLQGEVQASMRVPPGATYGRSHGDLGRVGCEGGPSGGAGGVHPWVRRELQCCPGSGRPWTPYNDHDLAERPGAHSPPPLGQPHGHPQMRRQRNLVMIISVEGDEEEEEQENLEEEEEPC